MYKSTLITLGGVIEDQLIFNIPIYQRLYVWGADQIKVLLDDLVAASEAGREGEFYLGGTLVIEQGKSDTGHPLLDLIDGQQRFTTLWLLSIAFQRLVAQRGKQEVNHLAEYRFAMSNDQRVSRIHFAIRPEVSRFFEALLDNREVPDVRAASSLSYAIREMEGYFNEHPNLSLDWLSWFIRHNVRLVLTTVPARTDLNKLFEVINNRGLQLQQHEILKATLLARLADRRQREIYGQLWDACSHMNDYVEKNLRTVTGLKLVPLYDENQVLKDDEALANPAHVRYALERLYQAQEEQTLTLDQILGNTISLKEIPRVGLGDETYEADAARSIITFPMLLQHVLRIFLKNKHHQEGDSDKVDIKKILDKELLQIFRTHWLDDPPTKAEELAAEVKEFIDLLWKSRYLFDKYVIKWVEDDEDEIHAIRRLRINTSRGSQSLVRKESQESDTAFAMLQSMLYHSQQLTTHYWLTPFLNYLLEHGGESAHLYLKYLDNHLLCSNSDAPLIERTRQFLNQPWCDEFGLRDFTDTLSTEEGTSFSHYWFYKLEYILWEKYREGKSDDWKAFRKTAKNSVEHVSPQKPEEFDSNKVTEKVLNTFGNLALVSRSINSEYSNKPYAEKRARFRDRNSGRADSLKLSLIYENEHWNDELALQHREQMIEEFQEYMANVDENACALAPK